MEEQEEEEEQEEPAEGGNEHDDETLDETGAGSPEFPMAGSARGAPEPLSDQRILIEFLWGVRADIEELLPWLRFDVRASEVLSGLQRTGVSTGPTLEDAWHEVAYWRFPALLVGVQALTDSELDARGLRGRELNAKLALWRRLRTEGGLELTTRGDVGTAEVLPVPDHKAAIPRLTSALPQSTKPRRLPKWARRGLGIVQKGLAAADIVIDSIPALGAHPLHEVKKGIEMVTGIAAE